MSICTLKWAEYQLPLNCISIGSVKNGMFLYFFVLGLQINKTFLLFLSPLLLLLLLPPPPLLLFFLLLLFLLSNKSKIKIQNV